MSRTACAAADPSPPASSARPLSPALAAALVGVFVVGLLILGVPLYWGWYVRTASTFLPLVLAQILFAFGVDALLQWSRRDTYRLGFLAKELLRWRRDGRSTRVFNPSSFPLAVASLVLVVTGTSELMLGRFIADTQFDPPHIYLLIFLVSLPGQMLFGIARMTLAAVITTYAISQAFLAATGTYLFFDSHIPIAVFLGMHLLFTDPSTSPRSGSGRIAFGVLYGLGT